MSVEAGEAVNSSMHTDKAGVQSEGVWRAGGTAPEGQTGKQGLSLQHAE